MATYPNMGSAVAVLQTGINTFRRTARLVALRLMRLEGDFLPAPGIVVNQGEVWGQV